MLKRRILLSAAALCVLPMASEAAPFYSENFEVDPSANWTVNNGPSDAAVNHFFDYSTAGIPSAPNSGGTTRGLKIQANQTNGIFSGVSTSPTGQNFVGDHKLKFNWWSNFNGPAPVGGSGSTQLSTFGVGTSGTVAQWPGGTQNSVWFAVTADGNSASDWRAYSTAATTSYLPASGVYAAGTGTSPDSRNSSHAYYASFGGNTAPAAQLALFPQQTGSTLVGSPAFEWHDVEIYNEGGLARWFVDGTLIATIDLATVTLAGGNIFFGHSDTNGTSSTDVNDVNLLFTLIDNVVVDQVPEPSGLALLGLGCLSLIRRRKA